MVIMSLELLNCKINPTLDTLDKLNSIHSWIPSSKDIRPTPLILQEKDRYLESIQYNYQSYKDYVLIELFLSNSIFNPLGKLEIEKPEIENKKLFIENKFPYLDKPISNHYIMWYSNYIPTDEVITQDIDENTANILHHPDYQFIWYENPKMSIPDIYHVHVFWKSNIY